MDYIRIAKIREEQQVRMARQSWDYVNQNSPIYPELASLQDRKDRNGNQISVQDAMKIITLSNKENK